MGCGGNLLGPEKKVIKPYNTGGFLAIKGPSVMEDMFLTGLEIPYHSVSKQWGILLNGGESITIKNAQDNHNFLLIRVEYTSETEADHYVTISRGGISQHISYVYLETSNSKYRLSPLILTNPSGKKPIYVSYMISSIDNILNYFIEKNDTLQTNMIIENILFDNIRSSLDKNSLWIYQDDSLVLTINNDKIINYWKEERSIFIDDVATGIIELKFQDAWNARQALSSISWFLNDTINRSLPQPADNTAPTIAFKPIVVLVGTNYTASIPLNSGSTLGILNKTDLITKLIEEIIDLRDGIISLDESFLIIKEGSMIKDAITQTGNYTVTISVSDIAGNEKIENVILTVI